MKKSILYGVTFVLFILAGIVVKRVYGHPEFVVLFHIPGAVFLVLLGMSLKEMRSEDYEEEVALVRRDLDCSD